MRLSQAWTIASKDLSIFRKKRNILYSTILFPVLVSIGLPLVVKFAGGASGGIPAALLPQLMNSFMFFFIIGAGTLPTAIASYSMVGEKVEKSLEPLLATPTTDSEILLGKSAAALLPPLVSIYAGATIFMALMDRFTYDTLGYLFFPNWSAAVTLLLVAPMAAICSVEVNVIISARFSDVRAAQQLGGILVLPFAGIYVAAEIGLATLNVINLLAISGTMLVVDALLFYVATATFRREEILTKWK